MEQKLAALPVFKKSVEINYAKIGICEGRITDALTALEEYKQDPMFIQAKDNYLQLYQRLMAQEERYVRHTQPDIEKLMATVKTCAPSKQLNELQEQVEVAKRQSVKIESKILLLQEF